MKTLVALFALAVLPSFAHAELKAADIQSCLHLGGDKSSLLSLPDPKQHRYDGFRYKFEGSDVFKIQLPKTNSRPFALPRGFKSAQGLCFTSTAPDGIETRDCAKNVAPSSERLTGGKLNEAFQATMANYIEQVGEFRDGDDPNAKADEDQRLGQGSEVKELILQFEERCESLGPLNQDAQASYADAKKAIASLARAYGLKAPNAPAKSTHGAQAAH